MFVKHEDKNGISVTKFNIDNYFVTRQAVVRPNQTLEKTSTQTIGASVFHRYFQVRESKFQLLKIEIINFTMKDFIN